MLHLNALFLPLKCSVSFSRGSFLLLSFVLVACPFACACVTREDRALKHLLERFEKFSLNVSISLLVIRVCLFHF